jgi:uncharacterized membrane protein
MMDWWTKIITLLSNAPDVIRGAIVSVAAAALFTACQWAGIRSKFGRFGGGPAWGSPVPFKDVWWHFPMFAVVFFLLFVIGPLRRARRDSR